MRHAYPILLDVSERLVVTVGGGSVAARKSRGVVDAGATRVRVVAPELRADFPPGVEHIAEPFEPRHLEGAGLVFAATDSAEVNEAVLRESRSRGVLACRADSDEAEPGDFVTPAKLVQGPIFVAVSAGSAALSARLRDKLAERIDVAWVQMAEAMQRLRPAIRDLPGLAIDRRAEIFRALCSDDALERVATRGSAGLVTWLKRKFPELKSAQLPALSS